MLADDARMRLRRKVADFCGVPMITARHAAGLIHALLHDSPIAFRRQHKRVKVDLKSVRNRIVVNACGEPARADERLPIKAGAFGNGEEFIRSVSRMPAASAAL